MADQQPPMSGAFSNPYVDTVASQVNEDFVASQNERRDQENSLLQGEQKLAAAAQKTADAQHKARLKAEEDYLSSLRKEEEAARKQEFDLMKKLPTIPGGLWKSQADPLVNGAYLIREKLPELIETHGVEGAYRIIAELDSATRELQGGYNSSSQEANDLARNLGQPIGNENIEATTQEEYDAIWNNLNNSDRFSLDIDPNGQWIVSDQENMKMPLRDWIQSSLTESAQSWKGRSELNLYKGVADAVKDTYSGGIVTKSETALSSWLDDMLNPSNLLDPTKGKKHYLSALAIYSQDPDNPTYEKLTDPNQPAVESRVQATEQYKKKYMALAAQIKAEGTASSGSGVTAESVMSEAVGTPYADEGTRSFLAQEFNLGIMPQDLDATGIIGLAKTKPVDLTISATAARKLKIVPDTERNTLTSVKINAAAFSSKGDMFIQFKGRMNKTQDQIDKDQARLFDLGIIEPTSEESLQHSYGVIKYGSDEWINAVESIGAKRASTVSKKKAIKSKYGDIRDDKQVNFWVGLASLAEETNSRFINEVLSAVESEGITIDEIKSLMD